MFRLCGCTNTLRPRQFKLSDSNVQETAWGDGSRSLHTYSLPTSLNYNLFILRLLLFIITESEFQHVKIFLSNGVTTDCELKVGCRAVVKYRSHSSYSIRLCSSSHIQRSGELYSLI